MLSHETGKVGRDRFCTEACTVQGFGLYPEDRDRDSYKGFNQGNNLMRFVSA